MPQQIKGRATETKLKITKPKAEKLMPSPPPSLQKKDCVTRLAATPKDVTESEHVKDTVHVGDQPTGIISVPLQSMARLLVSRPTQYIVITVHAPKEMEDCDRKTVFGDTLGNALDG